LERCVLIAAMTELVVADAPVNLHWCSDAALEMIADLSARGEAPMHMHLVETAYRKEYARRGVDGTALDHMTVWLSRPAPDIGLQGLALRGRSRGASFIEGAAIACSALLHRLFRPPRPTNPLPPKLEGLSTHRRERIAIRTAHRLIPELVANQPKVLQSSDKYFLMTSKNLS
jgi:hypothetical protein